MSEDEPRRATDAVTPELVDAVATTKADQAAAGVVRRHRADEIRGE